MKGCFVLFVIVFSSVANAGGPIGPYLHPDIIWRGDFEGGVGSLRNNCYSATDGWCSAETVRPDQIQIVEDPVAQGRYAARFEVKYGDVYTNPWNGITLSDSRTLLDSPAAAYEVEGNERWYRWQVLLPPDFVSDYPRWDQLGSSNETTSARQPSGYAVVWHHEGDGSSPLYIDAYEEHFTMCLVDFTTRSCTHVNLAPLVRGRWVDFVLHAKWSSDPQIGFLEMWMDGELVLPQTSVANMYPGLRNWWVVGLYRSGHIGDPNLRYTTGEQVYGSNGTPTVIYLDGFVIGKTWESVMSAGVIPRPGNLIVNGDFSLGWTGWERWDTPRISAGGEGQTGGEGQIGAGNGDARFAQSVTVLPNHQYRLAFRMKTENVTGSFGTLVTDAISGVSRLSGALVYAPRQGYVDYIYSFNSDRSGSVYVYIGNWNGSTGNAYISDVSLVDRGLQAAQPTPLVQSGFVSALSFGLGRILRNSCLDSQCTNQP